jgi:hypothetical protein
MHKIIILLIISMVLAGCSYSVYSTGYPHLKTITIQQFQNSTTEYQLESELFQELSDRFEQDGRLSIVGISPDCQIEGGILDYSDKIYSYNTEGIEEYQVRILFKIIFTDLVKNEVIYQNDSLVLSAEYSSADPEAEFTSEEEARYEIYKDLFDLILKETLEQW